LRKNYKRIHHRERMTDRERMHIVIARVTVNACTTVEERPFHGRVKLPTLCTGFSR
jgi:hypothetical protein